MKHEVTTMNTKKMLVEALKYYMEKKPLSKITISEIANHCNLNRKTFYYHFEDIYALLKWMLEQEAIEVVRQFNFISNPEDAILFVMDYVDSNSHILNCAYDSMGRDEMKRFLYTDFLGIVRSIIDKGEQELNINVDEEFKVFMASFYTEALSAVLIKWLRERGPRNREKTINNIILICQTSIPNILLAKANEA